MNEVKKRLMRTTNGPLKLTFIGEILRSSTFNDIHPKMDHLVCFLSGTLALGYYHEVIKSPKIRGHSLSDDSVFTEHLSTAEKLARTCYMMYNLTKTGLSPEIAYFDEGSDVQEYQIRPADAHNLLRPEFVESLFYLYHITGDQKYRTWGWNVSIQLIFNVLISHLILNLF
jgi:mannosyl-oligosaccharide alpha-1,2-mannosidase